MLEREALQSRIFPRLQTYCQERGAQFLAVDLRWGITEAAQVEHDTLRICLDEIRRSQELSPRPNFAVFIGNRYGWEPIPARIPVDHWTRLLENASPSDSKTIRSAYYPKPDKNAIPPAYILKSREGDWSSNEPRELAVQASLRRCAQSFEGADRLPYFASATHQEIVLGAMETPDAKEHVHVYIRRINNLPISQEAKAFIDWDSKTNQLVPGASIRLKELENNLKDKLPEMVREYSTDWIGEDNPNLISDDYIDNFCEIFYQDQVALIDQELALLSKREPHLVRAELHDQFAINRSENFVGRTSTLKAINQYISLNKKKNFIPLILYGEGGTGKSAIMAYAFRNTQISHPNAAVLARFIGGVPGCEDIGSILRDLIEDICRIYQAPPPQEMSSTKELNEAFDSILHLASEDKPLILFLDAIDQLSNSDNAWLLEWLPKELPSHTRMILTSRQGPTLDNAKRRLPKSLKLVPAMSHSDGAKMLDAWLGSYKEARFNAGIAPTIGRKLSNTQRRSVLGQFKNCPKPLWLKLVYEEVRAWRSWDEPRIFPNDIKSMVSELIHVRLLKDAKHLPIFTQRALAYIAAGRFGLSEDELAKALGSDEAVKKEFQDAEKTDKKWPLVRNQLPPILWSRLYFDLAPYLTTARIDGAILFRYFHREFKEVIEEELLAGKAGEAIHASLAIMFSMMGDQNTDTLFRQTDAGGQQQSPALRRIMEEPWQLAKANQHEKLIKLLTNFGYCMAKCSANRSSDLLEDYQASNMLKIGSSEAEIWFSFMQANANLLRRGVIDWPAHKILLQVVSEHSDSSPVSIALKNWLSSGYCTWKWIKNNTNVEGFVDTFQILEGHSGGFSSFIAMELIDDQIISRHNEYRVWNLSNAECDSIYPILNPPLIVSSTKNNILLDKKKNTTYHGKRIYWSKIPQKVSFRDCQGWKERGMCNALELLDGRVATTSKFEIKILDVYSKIETSLTLQGHSDLMIGFCQLSEGLLVSWALDCSIRIWDINTGNCLFEINDHEYPVIDVLEVSLNNVLSWDESGNFLLSSIKDKCSYILDGFENQDLWGSTNDADDFSIGAIILPPNQPAHFLAWNRGQLNWFDENSLLIRGRSNSELTGLEFIPGFGLATVDLTSNEILLTNFDDIEVACTRDEVSYISGLLYFPNEYLITWTGYKGGDDALRLWAPKDGNWSMGLNLCARIETNSRWIYNVFLISNNRVAICSEDDNLRICSIDSLLENCSRENSSLISANEVEGYRFTDLMPAGRGLYQACNFNYNFDKKQSLVIVDESECTIKIIPEIQVGMFSPGIERISENLIVLDHQCVVDLDKNVIVGDLGPVQEGTSKCYFEKTGKNSWLRLSFMNINKVEDEKLKTTLLEASVCCNSFFGEFGILGTERFELESFFSLFPLENERFVIVTENNNIQIWRINTDWPETLEVFYPIGHLLELDFSIEKILCIGADQFIAWSSSGNFSLISSDDGIILSSIKLNDLIDNVIFVESHSIYCWGKSGYIWILNLEENKFKAESFDINEFIHNAGSINYLVGSLFLVYNESNEYYLVDLNSRECRSTLRGGDFHITKYPNINFGDNGILSFNTLSRSFIALSHNLERLKFYDEISDETIYWHFNRGSDRDGDRLAAISQRGKMVFLANNQLNTLSVMNGAAKS